MKSENVKFCTSQFHESLTCQGYQLKTDGVYMMNSGKGWERSIDIEPTIICMSSLATFQLRSSRTMLITWNLQAAEHFLVQSMYVAYQFPVSVP
jgi:hypothetical protein